MAISVGDAVVELGLDTGNFDRGIDGVTNRLDKASGKWGKNLKVAGGVMLGAVAGVGGASLKMATDFESAFAGVRKTVDATDEELLKIDADLREMTKHLPVSYVELARIAEAAGQLGIKQEDIISFTETIAKLGMASNITGEEGATSLARFMNITGMAKGDIDKLGAVIVELGNNSATTEAEIVDMAMRIAAAGHTVGMTETEIMATSAALSSMGLKSEAGGTAFSRTLLEMNSAVAAGGPKLETFAQAAGMTAEEFKNRFEEDATGAVMAFIAGLGDLKSEGKDITPILDDLGLSGIRIVDTLLRMSGSQDILTDSQEIAAKAWEENIALNEEVAKRQETTASKMALLKNELMLTAAVIGTALIPVLVDLMEAVKPIIEKIAAWAKENPKLVKTILLGVGAIGGLLVIAGPLLNIFRGMAAVLPMMTAMFHSQTIALVAHKVASIAGAVATKIAAAAQWLLNVALSANPIGLIIIAVAALIAGIILLVKNWDWVKEKALAIWSAIGNAFTFITDKMGLDMAALGEGFRNIWDGIVGFFQAIPAKIKQAFSTLKDIMLAPFRFAINGIEMAINWLIRQINKIHVKLPDWLPGKLGGKGFGFNIPEISLPKFAKGGVIPEPTLLYGLKSMRPYAIAGEKGREFVSPSGAGITNNFNIAELAVREEADIARIARELYRLQQSRARMVGA